MSFLVRHVRDHSLQSLFPKFARHDSLIGGIFFTASRAMYSFTPQIPIKHYYFKNKLDGRLQQKHIPSNNNLRTHSRSVFKILQFIVKNQFPYVENNWSFTSGA